MPAEVWRASGKCGWAEHNYFACRAVGSIDDEMHLNGNVVSAQLQ